MRLKFLPDFFFVAGYVSCIAGLAHFSAALACIAGGALLMVVGVLTGVSQRPRRPRAVEPIGRAGLR
jgi:hypothetical protein